MIQVGRNAWDLVYETVTEWINDRASRKGAALAFYTVFSLAPILILSIAIAGLFFGRASRAWRDLRTGAGASRPDAVRRVRLAASRCH